MKGTVTLVRTDSESVYVHGAVAKHCLDGGIRVSPSATYLKEIDDQAERYFGVVMNMSRVLLEISGLGDV